MVEGVETERQLVQERGLGIPYAQASCAVVRQRRGNGQDSQSRLILTAVP